MVRTLKATAGVIAAGLAAAAPALPSPWKEVAIALVTLAASYGLFAVHTAAVNSGPLKPEDKDV